MFPYLALFSRWLVTVPRSPSFGILPTLSWCSETCSSFQFFSCLHRFGPAFHRIGPAIFLTGGGGSRKKSTRWNKTVLPFAFFPYLAPFQRWLVAIIIPPELSWSVNHWIAQRSSSLPAAWQARGAESCFDRNVASACSLQSLVSTLKRSESYIFARSRNISTKFSLRAFRRYKGPPKTHVCQSVSNAKLIGNSFHNYFFFRRRFPIRKLACLQLIASRIDRQKPRLDSRNCSAVYNNKWSAPQQI